MSDKLSITNLYRLKNGNIICQIYRRCQSFRAVVHSIEEGIELRDKVLQFYEKNHYLPSDEEIGFVRLIDRHRHELSEKHITFQPDYNRYVFHMVRGGKTLKANVKTKKQAIELRDRSIAFYEEFNRLPMLHEIGFEEIKQRKE